MPTINMTARKMSDASVEFISLVERGANRIPFKVIKSQENDMSKAFSGLDLGNFFRTQKKEKIEPTIVGVITMKGDGFESIKSKVAEAGFDVEHMEEMEDGSVVFKQGDAIEGEETVIRMNDHLAIVTKGFSPYNMEIGDGEVTFAEAAAARGFYPGINSIMSTLSEVIDGTVRKADSPANAQALVSKVFQEAGSYINSFLSGLPSKAFKLETVYPDAPQAEVAVKAEGETDPAAVIEPVSETPAIVAPATEGEGEGEAAVAKGEGEVAKPLTAEDVAAIVQSTVSDNNTSVMKAASDAFTKGLDSVTKTLEGLQGSMTALATRVESAESVAKAAKDAVTGTVVTGADDDNLAVKKRDRDYQGREIDTAYMSRAQRQANRH